MKNTIISTLVTIILFLLSAAPVDAQKKGDMDEFTVQVDGLGCPFCAYGLEKKIKKLKGIKKVKIDMEEAVMTFKYPYEKALTLAAVEKQVDEAGYTAVGTSVIRADGTEETSVFELSDKIDKKRVVKASILVAGVCGMCRARIKKVTRKIEGVVESEWDEDAQMLTIKYDKDLTNTEEIEKAIAMSGHDTQNVKAPDDVYENLPACCLYKRLEY